MKHKKEEEKKAEADEELTGPKPMLPYTSMFILSTTNPWVEWVWATIVSLADNQLSYNASDANWIALITVKYTILSSLGTSWSLRLLTNSETDTHHLSFITSYITGLTQKFGTCWFYNQVLQKGSSRRRCRIRCVHCPVCWWRSHKQCC